MKHQAPTSGATAADLERWLDRLAREIAAFGHRGRALLPIYARLETDLAAIRAEEDTLAKAMARLSRITR